MNADKYHFPQSLEDVSYVQYGQVWLEHAHGLDSHIP
mgnify:CR=1 FL=1